MEEQTNKCKYPRLVLILIGLIRLPIGQKTLMSKVHRDLWLKKLKSHRRCLVEEPDLLERLRELLLDLQVSRKWQCHLQMLPLMMHPDPTKVDNPLILNLLNQNLERLYPLKIALYPFLQKWSLTSTCHRFNQQSETRNCSNKSTSEMTLCKLSLLVRVCRTS